MNIRDVHTHTDSQLSYRTTFDAAQDTLPVSATKRGFKRTHDHLIQQPDLNNGTSPLSDITNFPARKDLLHQSVACHYKALKASLIINVEESTSQNGISVYTQRREIAATPIPASDPTLSLSHPAYGLSERLVQNFSNLGINSIYPWQSRCLLANNLLRGEGNLVYSAPTGGGKSLVADILMLKRVVEQPDQKAILVLPYVALVQEKLQWLRNVVNGIVKKTTREPERTLWRRRGDEDSVRVFGFFGGSNSKASWMDTDIAVCTIEKVCWYTPFLPTGI
jgi:hypothetical protein